MIFIVAKERKKSHNPPQPSEKSTHKILCENAQGQAGTMAQLLKARFTTQKMKMHRIGRRNKELERKRKRNSSWLRKRSCYQCPGSYLV